MAEKELFLVSIGYEPLALGTIDQAAALIKLLAKMTPVETDYQERDEAGNHPVRRREDCECKMKGGYYWTTPSRRTTVSRQLKMLGVDIDALPASTGRGLPVNVRRLLE